MNYTLNHFASFEDRRDAKCQCKAAEQLHLTQPAVSIQLKHLRAQFDIPLTESGWPERSTLLISGGRSRGLLKASLDQAMLINQRHAFKGAADGSAENLYRIDRKIYDALAVLIHLA